MTKTKKITGGVLVLNIFFILVLILSLVTIVVKSGKHESEATNSDKQFELCQKIGWQYDKETNKCKTDTTEHDMVDLVQ